MSSNPQTVARGDFASRLGAESYCADITVLEERRGVTENDIERALSVLNEKGGKIGACITVLKPILVPSAPNAPTAEFELKITVEVRTQPLFNDDTGNGGTGKQQEDITRFIRQLFHQYNGGYGTWTFAGQEPISVPEGQVGDAVTFRRLGRDGRYQKLALPVITPEESAVPATITIEGPADAEIYYTIDGTYPHADNDEATLYSAPFEITEPCTVRAVAYRSGWQPSNVAAETYAPNYEFTSEFSEEFA